MEIFSLLSIFQIGSDNYPYPTKAYYSYGPYVLVNLSYFSETDLHEHHQVFPLRPGPI
jgi:hypothetical protein